MLAAYMDSTYLKAEAKEQDIRMLCEQAVLYKMAAVCVNPYRLPAAAELLTDKDVKLCTVIGFPLGAQHSQIKFNEARLALQQGADELDMVINIGAFLDRDYNLVNKEIQALLILKNDYDFKMKVIVETALLNEAELVTVTELLNTTQVDFIKTSTGYSSRGVSMQDIDIIKTCKRKDLRIKASGGVRDLDFALQLIDAGVDRIGSSNAVQLVKEYRQRGGLEGR
ncbi:MAG: deoxyribose-phosphate aldolase [Syntrophomonadaceae bacterium]|nr:deoxyribose-phosphate aldolase [Syntrophomonadaceae bacterium]